MKTLLASLMLMILASTSAIADDIAIVDAKCMQAEMPLCLEGLMGSPQSLNDFDRNLRRTLLPGWTHQKAGAYTILANKHQMNVPRQELTRGGWSNLIALCRDVYIPINNPSCVKTINLPSSHSLNDALTNHRAKYEERLGVAMAELHGVIDRLNEIEGNTNPAKPGAAE